jgi:hypothetical protein
MVSALRLCALALLATVAVAELGHEELRSHCKLIALYASGPGSLEDSLHRWAFYFADHGAFKFLHHTASTPEEFIDHVLDGWEGFETHNHVYLPEEPEVHDQSCTFRAAHSFLAWNGQCGPVLHKVHISLDIDPRARTAAEGRLIGFNAFFDADEVVHHLHSCNPDGHHGAYDESEYDPHADVEDGDYDHEYDHDDDHGHHGDHDGDHDDHAEHDEAAAHDTGAEGAAQEGEAQAAEAQQAQA